MLIVSANNSGNFELPPNGAVAARCSRLIDLGSHESTFDGKTSMKRKILLTWELAELRTDGTPFQVSRRFGLSLHENSAMRAFLQQWRGRAFTPEELAKFDLAKLANTPCMLNIATVNRAGKDYANILSISPLPRGMEAPALAAPAVIFDIDADNAPAILETLSDSLANTITASPEWQARSKAANANAGTTGNEPNPFADLAEDIPF
jgi:hypothetical protein